MVVILYPDELHDGRAGSDVPFVYRTLYAPPSVIQAGLAGASLPFVEGGVSADPRIFAAVPPLLENLDRPLAGLELEDGIFDLVSALTAISAPTRRLDRRNLNAAEMARQFLEDHIEAQCGERGGEPGGEPVTLSDLEAATGRDRFALSRDFRAAFGTSPYRYLSMRRLERAKALIEAGETIAAAAAVTSFADQSHLTRQFKKAFGLTPDRWRKIVQDG